VKVKADPWEDLAGRGKKAQGSFEPLTPEGFHTSLETPPVGRIAWRQTCHFSGNVTTCKLFSDSSTGKGKEGSHSWGNVSRCLFGIVHTGTFQAKGRVRTRWP
jgi:hypothetical protein